MVYEVRVLLTMVSPESPLSGTLQPDRGLLMFMLHLGPLSLGPQGDGIHGQSRHLPAEYAESGVAEAIPSLSSPRTALEYSQVVVVSGFTNSGFPVVRDVGVAVSRSSDI